MHAFNALTVTANFNLQANILCGTAEISEFKLCIVDQYVGT